jgi:hypothetical protein
MNVADTGLPYLNGNMRTGSLQKTSPENSKLRFPADYFQHETVKPKTVG